MLSLHENMELCSKLCFWRGHHTIVECRTQMQHCFGRRRWALLTVIMKVITNVRGSIWKQQCQRSNEKCEVLQTCIRLAHLQIRDYWEVQEEIMHTGIYMGYLPDEPTYTARDNIIVKNRSSPNKCDMPFELVLLYRMSKLMPARVPRRCMQWHHIHEQPILDLISE